MRTRAGVIAAVVISFALTGCSGTVQAEPEGTEGTPPAASTPLTAESPAAAPSGQQAFVDAVRASLPAETQIPNATDDQLIEVGQRACAELAAGSDTTVLSLIAGEQPSEVGYFRDSQAIITAAATTLC